MMGSTSLQLSGTIASVLGDLNSLEEVDRAYNKLVGSIPAQLSSLSALGVLNLGNNTLAGTIPVQLSSMSGLAILSLSSNTLTGPIPWALVSRASTRRLQLDVRGNRLTLPNNITEEGGSFVVTSVNMSGWGLTGTIPAQLSSLSGLTTLDLSYNTLRGPIPSSLGSLSALQVLRLNNNLIVGGNIPADVPSVNFNYRSGDCKMGGQCSACSDEACFNYDWEDRRDTPMCRACGYFKTGTCLISNNCSNSTKSKDWCGADCGEPDPGGEEPEGSSIITDLTFWAVVAIAVLFLFLVAIKVNQRRTTRRIMAKLNPKLMQIRAEHAAKIAKIAHQSQLNKLEIDKAKNPAEIESQKFSQYGDGIKH
jgi:hypothetical protein